MIDWLVVKVRLLHKRINTGRVVKIDEHGEIDWESVTKFNLEGTYSANLQVVSNGVAENPDYATHLYFSGNPNKFISGHNVIGSSDIIKLTRLTVLRIMKTLVSPQSDEYTPITFYRGVAYPLNEIDLTRLNSGDFEVKIFDYNEYRQLPSQVDVESFLTAFEYHARSLRQRAERTGNTVYLQKRSRKWALKIYSKYNELLTGRKSHKLPNELEKTPLLEFTLAKIRLEMRLAQECKTIAQKYFNTDVLLGKHLTPDFVRYLFSEYWGRIKMNGQLELHNDDLATLPTRLHGMHELWKAGKDLRAVYKRSTYFRLKSELLNYGIDVSLPPVDLKKTNNVIPFVRIIRAEMVTIPENIKQYALS